MGFSLILCREFGMRIFRGVTFQVGIKGVLGSGLPGSLTLKRSPVKGVASHSNDAELRVIFLQVWFSLPWPGGLFEMRVHFNGGKK